MESWTNLTKHLRARDLVTEEGVGWVRCDRGDIRVKVRLTQAFQRPTLVVLAEVCPEDRMDARTALTANGGLEQGALVLGGGTYYLRHTAPVERTGPAEVADAVESLASAASAMQSVVRRVNPDPSCYSAYAY